MSGLYPPLPELDEGINTSHESRKKQKESKDTVFVNRHRCYSTSTYDTDLSSLPATRLPLQPSGGCMPLSRSMEKLTSELKPTEVNPEMVQNPAIARKQGDHVHIQIHDMVRKEKWDSLLHTLSTSKGAIDINAKNSDGNTALHIAVAENRDLECVKVLMAFGADVSHVNNAGQRPDQLQPKRKQVGDFVSSFLLSRKSVFERTVDETDGQPGIYARPGSRILFLDGGGIRGLAEIEMLMEIERITRKKIVDLFDWFVGTSTGGILALGLVYCGMSLAQLKSFYLEMKTQVFAGKLMKVFNIEKKTNAMEDILKRTFGIQTLASKSHPRVMIAVANKHGEPTLEFFNNFMNETHDNASRWLREAPVWYAARATSAAPLHFLACNDYIDGGIMANNPSMKAWSEIQRYCQATKQIPPKFSIAVSLGSGTFLHGSNEDRDIDMLGKSYFNVPQQMKRMKNFFEMLQKTLTQSESVASEFATLCRREGIPFFRFSPTFHNSISPGERNDRKILDMLVDTRLYCETEEVQGQLVRMSRVFNYLDHLEDIYFGRASL